ncbi:MAG: extracellular solute-binding protein [Clostridia bacterium]|nr:extracellular solute-binding protein [Clostridia bacterium]
MKKLLALVLAAVLLCGVIPVASAEGRETIEFWFHASSETTNANYEELFQILNSIQDEYEFVYTGFASANFPDAMNMAIATDTMPDVISTGFSNVTNWTAQDALIDMSDYFEKFEEKDAIDKTLLESLRNIGGGALYGVPYNYNQDMIWYNTKLFAENGIENAPATISEFMEMCEKYADPSNGKYFYSLRGVKPGDNLIGFIFTYADNGGEYFDENGKCVLSQPKFVEGLELYASLYKNGWVSGDSVNNNYNEMVAEFGAGTSMMIMHNSSSRANHEKNLGIGNFSAARPLANDESGNFYTSSIQPTLFAICKTKGEDGDYSGAAKLVEYLTSAEYVVWQSLHFGRIPVNSKAYDQAYDELVANDPFLVLYNELINDPHYKQAQNPYYLPGWFNFVNTELTNGFQAILTGEKTAQQVTEEWCAYLEGELASWQAAQ